MALAVSARIQRDSAGGKGQQVTIPVNETGILES